MEFVLSSLVLEIDVDKTKKLYQALEEVTDGCSCDGCRNYMLARERFPEAVKDFFGKLGVDPGKAAEIITWNAEDGGRALHYGGFYHLCGRLIKGDDCWQASGEMDTEAFYPVTKGYAVGFTDSVSLPEEGLPRPVLQMEIDFHGVPWLLDKENSY